MEKIDKLRILSGDMDIEPGEEHEGGCQAGRKVDGVVIYPAKMPGGKRIRLLKTLLTSVCERDCYYCAFRASRDLPRVTFQPEEFARLFMNLHAGGILDGLFISSGSAGGGIRTQDRLIDVAEILRFKLNFQGYIHLKVMPGAEKAQVERAMQLANRVSINLEGPNEQRLSVLTPSKVFSNELLQPLKWIQDIRDSQPAWEGWKHRWPSSTTQFVVGGAGESDVELLHTTDYLYRELHLQRAYYSAFKPQPGTPLSHHPAASFQRQHRLYQASFLLRDYGFSLEELCFQQDGNLSLDRDPKFAWAEQNLAHHPLDLNSATREELLRVPGIGPLSMQRILEARHEHRLTSISELTAMGIQSTRAAPFILLNGRRPAIQLALC